MLRLDEATGQVFEYGEQVAQLTVAERDILVALMNSDRPLRDVDLEETFHYARAAIRVHIKNIRAKAGRGAIETMSTGFGYRAGSVWERRAYATHNDI